MEVMLYADNRALEPQDAQTRSVEKSTAAVRTACVVLLCDHRRTADLVRAKRVFDAAVCLSRVLIDGRHRSDR